MFASCSKYQYYNLVSDNVPKNQEKLFVDQNDACDITYDFSGENGPIRITVYNKSTKPLEINWEKSALIFGQTSMSFFVREEKTGDEIKQDNISISQIVNAIFSSPTAIEFIPPQSSTTKQNFFINKKPLKLDRYVSTKETIRTKYSRKKLKRYQFSSANPPFFFRIYLTLQKDNNSFAVDHSFYVTDIIETRAGPDNFGLDGGDRFYLKGYTHFGNISAVVGAICITALLIAAL